MISHIGGGVRQVKSPAASKISNRHCPSPNNRRTVTAIRRAVLARRRPPMRASIRLGLGASLLFGALLTGISQSALAQQGTITGRVTDQATGDPLENARVVLVRPNRIEATGRDGRYFFRGVEPGSYLIRVLRLGYRPASDTVAVAAGEAATLDFALVPSPVQLEEIVTTATGQQSRLEIGNSVATIAAAQVAEEAPIA